LILNPEPPTVNPTFEILNPLTQQKELEQR